MDTRTPTSAAARRIRIAGLGNVLMGDDGIGPFIVEALRAGYEWPDEVSLIDLGTPGLDLVPFVADLDALVVIDAAAEAAPPGTIRVYGGEEVKAGVADRRLAAHDPGLGNALALTALEGREPPRVVVVGIVPERVAVGPGLSDSARAAVPRAVEAVIAEMRRLGAEPRRRNEPAPADPWWERHADAAARRDVPLPASSSVRDRTRPERLLRALVVLVALHSAVVGALLLFATRWGAAVGGWADVTPLFFARQAGAFHLVVAAVYLIEYFRNGTVTLLLTAKSIAVVFLVATTLIDGDPWVVPMSAAGDAAMGAAVYLVFRQTKKTLGLRP